MKEKENRRDRKVRAPRGVIVAGLEARINAASGRIGTRKEAARAAGVSTDSLQRYLRGERIPPFDVAAALAKAAGLSLDWLASGRTEAPGLSDLCPTPVPAPDQPNRRTAHPDQPAGVPIIVGYDALISWIAEKGAASTSTRHPTGAAVGSNGYALRMTGRAMEPVFLSGSMAIIDPDQPARCDDYVVLAVEEWKEVVLRRWVVDLGRVRLEPLAQGYRTVDITDLDYVYGGRVVRVETVTGASS